MPQSPQEQAARNEVITRLHGGASGDIVERGPGFLFDPAYEAKMKKYEPKKEGSEQFSGAEIINH